MNRASDAVQPDVVVIKDAREGVSFEIALQYSTEYTENVQSYVNNIHTIEGGTHVSGFRSALTRALNTYGKKEGMFKDLAPTGDDFREGLTAVISVRVPHPQFEGQTKTKLGKEKIESIINNTVDEERKKYQKKKPKNAPLKKKKSILD